MADRRNVTIQEAPGGWPTPWANVAEIEAVLPCENWTLIGGLMVQLHAIHRQIDALRPTNDIDIIVHVETGAGRPARVAAALRSLHYDLRPNTDPRTSTAHRFLRGPDIVDVVVADHAAPRVLERLRGYEMVNVAGGTQALRRTMNATLTIVSQRPTVISVPDPLGALILKAAAHRNDTRDPERHLADAAVLLACIEDPFEDRESFGSDRARLLHLRAHLGDPLHPAWQRLPLEARRDAQSALGLLCG